ncbi:MAG: radical SAM protein [Deltaproteobacteria bacterium]|nr:radical SAM protein [Deltaproteobacteria bacterium]
MSPSLILINPWIYDFAAYDLWSKPLGLLYLGAYLRDCGFNIHLIDCLDVHHPAMIDDPSRKAPKRRQYGTGKFWRKKVPRPLPVKNIERQYSRYGISHEAFAEELRNIGEPSAVLVTSLMTYWYPGVMDVIAQVKETYPDVPVILGGIYARLCRDHAVRNSGADHVVADRSPMSLMKILNKNGIPIPEHLPDTIPYPAFDLLSRIDYICLLTSRGCPYRCQYCASHFLDPDVIRRDPDEILAEIHFWHRDYGVRDFAFYDDALLVESDTHAGVLLEHLAKQALNLRFHTPNALHVKEITPDIAKLMYLTGFKTIRLGLETSDFSLHTDLDNKVAEGDFDRAVHNLLAAGFSRNEIGAYMFVGLPGQTVDSVIKTIEFVARVGVIPYLAEYSPIPHTALWEKAIRHSEYDLASEPLFHNNTLLPCWNNSQKKEIPKLRQMVLEVRKKYRRPA